MAFLTIADGAINFTAMSRFSLQSAALPAALLCVSVFTLPVVSYADLVYRPNEGWVREGVSILGTSTPVAKTADLQLKYAQDMEAKGDFDKASDAYKRLVKVFPLSQQASEARYKLGETLEKKGRFEDAFEAYDELVVKHQAETTLQNTVCELRSQNKKLSARIAELEAFHSDPSGLAENRKLSDKVTELKSLLRTSTENFQKARSHIESLKLVINRLRRARKPSD